MTCCPRASTAERWPCLLAASMRNHVHDFCSSDHRGGSILCIVLRRSAGLMRTLIARRTRPTSANAHLQTTLVGDPLKTSIGTAHFCSAKVRASPLRNAPYRREHTRRTHNTQWESLRATKVDEKPVILALSDAHARHKPCKLPATRPSWPKMSKLTVRVCLPPPVPHCSGISSLT